MVSSSHTPPTCHLWQCPWQQQVVSFDCAPVSQGNAKHSSTGSCAQVSRPITVTWAGKHPNQLETGTGESHRAAVLRVGHQGGHRARSPEPAPCPARLGACWLCALGGGHQCRIWREGREALPGKARFHGGGVTAHEGTGQRPSLPHPQASVSIRPSPTSFEKGMERKKELSSSRASYVGSGLASAEQALRLRPDLRPESRVNRQTSLLCSHDQSEAQRGTSYVKSQSSTDNAQCE